MRARKAERNKKMLQDYESGIMQKDIAEKYGLSRGRVCKIINNERTNRIKGVATPRKQGRELIALIDEMRARK